MRLLGLHHITCICADARANVEFYARVLGLRLVKKTVNFDQPDVYHLYYGDERGAPGSILTFFEFPGAAPGRAGAGMIHRLTWRVRSEEAIAFWATRVRTAGARLDESLADPAVLRFRDPEGLELELRALPGGPELAARAEGVPAEHALQGFAGVRAYATGPEEAAPLLTDTLGFAAAPDAGGAAGAAAYELGGMRYAVDPPPATAGIQGAGTVHHIAWACEDDDQPAWRERVAAAGAHVTSIRDRQYFRSIYFREPCGVLFEIATLSPGFAVDEDSERLGTALRLPPQYEDRRAELERRLTPLPDLRG